MLGSLAAFIDSIKSFFSSSKTQPIASTQVEVNLQDIIDSNTIFSDGDIYLSLGLDWDQKEFHILYLNLHQREDI